LNILLGIASGLIVFTRSSEKMNKQIKISNKTEKFPFT